MLLATVRDRKARSEIGSGYGTAMQQVIAREIVPLFHEEQYSAGIVTGVRETQAALSQRISS